MIEIGFDFHSSARFDVITAVLGLPEEFRPTHVCDDNEKAGPCIKYPEEFAREFMVRETGELLLGPRGTFSIKLAGSKPIHCSFLLDVSAGEAQEIVHHLCMAKPIFGFACLPAEREYRNRTIHILGANTIESWVGRDVEKYIPGFYWITVISDELLRRHNVALADFANIAADETEPVKGLHVLRFYDTPEDWQNSAELTGIMTSFSGVFNIEEARSKMEKASNFLELNSIYRDWK